MNADHNPAGNWFRAGATNRRTNSGLLITGLVQGAATVSVAVVSGIFVDWAFNIMPALSTADDQTYIVFMQQAITTMNNSPVFLLTVLGGLVFTGAAAILQRRLGSRTAARWIIGALLLYVVALMITAGVHFPLNNAVEQAGDPDAIPNLGAIRADTEEPWTTGHALRTAASMAALSCLCRALWLRHTKADLHRGPQLRKDA